MPRLWTDTIQTHRRTVRDATLDATAALIAKHGLRGVTMSQIAEATGIGRATLYKYFPDVEAILLAWHEREISGHLEQLAKARDAAGDVDGRLEAVFEAYATIAYESRGHHDAELVALLHRDEQVIRAEHYLRSLVRELLVDAARAGLVRDDVAPGELVGYSLHALSAASRLRSKSAVRRLVAITMSGLRPSASQPISATATPPSP
jgi:AcrR family transcriptional regulator